MTTLKDIAEAAGISPIAVSRILNGQNKENRPSAKERAERVRQLAKEMNYQPSASARAMRTGKLTHVGMMLSGAYQAPFEFPLTMGVNEALQAAGYQLSLISSTEVDLQDPVSSKVFQEQNLAGIVSLHVAKTLRDFIPTHTANTIWVDSNVRDPFDCVYRDEVYAGSLCAQSLLRLGYRRFVYVGLEPWEDCQQHVQDRLDGVSTALAQAETELTVLTHGLKAKDYAGAVPRLIEKLAPSVAVITVGQNVAEWVSHVGNAHGLCVGKDFALSSVSEMLHANTTWPHLSRVGFRRAELGRHAGDMMVKKLAGQSQVPSMVQRGDWILGGTTPPCPC